MRKPFTSAILAAWTLAALSCSQPPAANNTTAPEIAAADPAVEGPQYQVDPHWPKPLPNNWILGQVSGVAVDAEDHVWIINRPRSLTDDERGAVTTPQRSKCCVPAPPVIAFDQEGNVIASWGGPGEGYDWPATEHGIQIDPDGNVWLAGSGASATTTDADASGASATADGMALKFTPQGKFLLQIGKSGPPAGSLATDQLGRAANFGFDAATKEIFIADGYGNRRVIVFDYETGAFKRMWGAYGKPPTDDDVPLYDGNSRQFSNPVHCARIAQDGLVYVCDRLNNRIQVFHKDGTFVKQFVQEPNTRANGSIWDIVFVSDDNQKYMLVADGANNEIRVTRREDGVAVSAFGRSGRMAGQFHWVHNLALDSHDNLFSTEVDNGKRVQKWLKKR